MHLQKLVIHNFRNLEHVEIEPSSGFNFICGPNGSGKTSLLEAIGYLALGRSFRGAAPQYLVRQGSSEFSLFAEVREEDNPIATTLGLSRPRSGSLSLKLNANPVTRLIDFVDHLCLQIIHPQGVDLITKEAEGRRNFIDWGVYFSDPEFKTLWTDYCRILKQRNCLLRDASAQRRHSRIDRDGSLTRVEKYSGESLEGLENFSCFAGMDTVSIWDEKLVVLSEKITEKRLAYLKELQLLLKDILAEFLPNFKLSFELAYGWDKGVNLRTLLARNLERDKVFGYTLCGCHRADLKIKNNCISAGATLSRGQLKMLVYAMRLAQGMLLQQQTGRSCIYLIDDLGSELDSLSQRKLLTALFQCNHQVFISNIQHKNLSPEDSSNYKIFDLDGGKVSFS